MIGIGEHGKQVNLGADDKNGVWIGLQMLKYESAIKLAFFVGEEIGCVGSSGCNMDFFKNVKYVIQCDRKNGHDFINRASGVELCTDSFVSKELKEKYGYKDTFGSVTDVMTLKEQGLNVACCNMSCGYYNPHTSTEFTNVKELINCLKFVREIVQTTPLTLHKYEHSRFYQAMGRNKAQGYANMYAGAPGSRELVDYYGIDIY